MIIKLLLEPIFFLIESIIYFIPEGASIPSWLSFTVDILKYPMSIFPADVWILMISNVSFWYMAQMTWAIVEWIIKKIPGVN